MRPRASLAALLTLTIAFSCSALAVEPPPGVGQWMSGIRALREQDHAIARAHLQAMVHVDGRILAAQLAMVCRAVELAARDAGVRARTASDSVAGRVRASFLPLVARRLQTRTECVSGTRWPATGSPGDLARRLDSAVALFDLSDDEVTAIHRALADVEKADEDMEEAVLEVGDWQTRYDELLRNLSRMNLALRHAHHGQAVGAGERAFEHLRELLGDDEG